MKVTQSNAGYKCIMYCTNIKFSKFRKTQSFQFRRHRFRELRFYMP